MTDKPYIEPLGGSYVVEKPGAAPVRKEWTDHGHHGAPESRLIVFKPESTFQEEPGDSAFSVMKQTGATKPSKEGK